MAGQVSCNCLCSCTASARKPTQISCIVDHLQTQASTMYPRSHLTPDHVQTWNVASPRSSEVQAPLTSRLQAATPEMQNSTDPTVNRNAIHQATACWAVSWNSHGFSHAHKCTGGGSGGWSLFCSSPFLCRLSCQWWGPLMLAVAVAVGGPPAAVGGGWMTWTTAPVTDRLPPGRLGPLSFSVVLLEVVGVG